MSQPFVGEIRLFAGNFAPAGWAFCQGQLLPISGNETLFNLIGTTYGGDGQSTFALPDLRGRVPVHATSGVALGSSGGDETVTLTTQQIPAHHHVVNATTTQGTQRLPTGNLLASIPAGGALLYRETQTPNATLADGAVASDGGSRPHENMQPYIAINYIISLFGIYPSPS